MRLLIFGYGFSGAAIARLAMARGWSVAGTSRSAEGRAAMQAVGVEPHAPDACAPADAILVAAPPTAEGCPALAALSPALTAEPPAWLGYLSTTGVYGDRGGGWVLEDSPLIAASPEGLRRVQAERAWTEAGAQHGFPVAFFRLPGIYGPGRSPLDRLRAGEAKRLDKPGQVFSRIHVDDLANGVMAAMQRPEQAGAYNLCDDEPAPAAEVTGFAATLLGMEPPPLTPFDAGALSPAAQRFWAESKRISNARAKGALDWRPAYPSYREGLAAVLAAGG